MADLAHDVRNEWTLSDLDELPDDGARYEIVDGSLAVSPAPRLVHQVLAGRLSRILSQQSPQATVVVEGAGVSYGRSYRIPDVMVLRWPAPSSTDKTASPSDVLLAVEIVSPTSLTTDRVTKPAEYAAAGIAAFWRVETDPELTVTACVLRPGEVYAELGTWTSPGVLDVADPFPVRVELGSLLA